MIITPEQFYKCFPGNTNPEGWADAINSLLPIHNINTQLRVCHFLAQYGHETNGFTALMENLNYSANALVATWPKRFRHRLPGESLDIDEGQDGKAIAERYARQPEKIANRAYANRMGNGPESSGDGWKHRGMGGAQLTGKDNQSAFANAIGKTLDDTVEYLQTIEGALASACWFWCNNGLSRLADDNNLLAITKRINGGTNGLDDRKARYARISQIVTVI